MRLIGLATSWTVATAVGYLLTFYASLAVALTLPFFFECDVSAWPVPDACEAIYRITLFPSLFIGGCALGLLQFAVFAFFLASRSPWWIPATALGYALPAYLEASRPGTSWQDIEIPYFLLLGFLLGVAQWLALRPTFRRASLWIPATVASAALAAALANQAQAWPVFALVFGAATAVGLVFLVHINRTRRWPAPGA